MTFALSLIVLHLILTTILYIYIDNIEDGWFIVCAGLSCINIFVFPVSSLLLVGLLGSEEMFYHWWSRIVSFVLIFECLLGLGIFLYWGLLGPRGTNFRRIPLSSYSSLEIEEVLESLIRETKANKSIEWHEKEAKYFYDWRIHCSFWVNVSGNGKKLYRIFRFDGYIRRLFRIKPYWELWITEDDELSIRPISSREFFRIESLVTAVMLQIKERYEREEFMTRKGFLNSVGARLDEEILEELGIRG